MKDWRDEKKKTTTATEDFKKNLMYGKRYVDKTPLLASLLEIDHETTFFLRPRRFGKTLTLSMIRYFVEDTRDPALNQENRSLFQGLKIMGMGERYTDMMTSFPVIHLTLQTVKGSTYEIGYRTLVKLIRELYLENKWLLESNALDENETQYFRRMLAGKSEDGEMLGCEDIHTALQYLSKYMREVTGKHAVVLIDEYDVPLENAYRNGYYRKMVDVIGPMLQNVLKTNSDNLQFAVVTGCLRIAKEGIYTGLNNPEINTVDSDAGNDVIGFTEPEVRQLLADSGLENHFDEVKEWYDGYRFGETVIYNPWSVIKFIESLKANPNARPRLYWAGTSENAIVRELAEHADDATREKAETLVQGGEITFAARDDIVYDDLFRDPDNVFNVMLATGYLTAVDRDVSTVRARIPNKEVMEIFKRKFSEWFQASLSMFNVQELYAMMEDGNAERVEEILNDQFLSSMSYFDTIEAFYHGVTLALMQLNQNYVCTSNRESGSGRFDVQCKQKRRWKLAFVLEFKVSDLPKHMIMDAHEAVSQIKDKNYVSDLLQEGYEKVMTYGFAFCGKRCRVVRGETYSNV